MQAATPDVPRLRNTGSGRLTVKKSDLWTKERLDLTRRDGAIVRQ